VKSGFVGNVIGALEFLYHGQDAIGATITIRRNGGWLPIAARFITLTPQEPLQSYTVAFPTLPDRLVEQVKNFMLWANFAIAIMRGVVMADEV